MSIVQTVWCTEVQHVVQPWKFAHKFRLLTGGDGAGGRAAVHADGEELPQDVGSPEDAVVGGGLEDLFERGPPRLFDRWGEPVCVKLPGTSKHKPLASAAAVAATPQGRQLAIPSPSPVLGGIGGSRVNLVLASSFRIL